MFDCVKIKIKGSFTFIVNFFVWNKINIKKPKYSDGYVYFYVKGRDKDNALELIKKKFGDFEIVKDNSIKTFFSTNFKRVGLFIGLAVVIICISLMSVCTTNLEIKGNKEIPTKTIEKVVNDYYKIPNFNKNLDNKELVSKLILLDGIASASVEKRGNTVFVEVYEELPKVPIVDKTEYKDIVSSYDAIITRIVSFSGTPLKKVGDVVKKGDVLISTKIQLGEELTVDTHTSGEVYGKVCIKKETFIPETVMVKKRTGNKIIIDKFFGKEPKNPEIPFEEYEMEKQEIVLDNTLCLTANRYVYYELKNVVKNTKFTENEKFYVKEYTNKYMSSLPKDCKFLRSWYNVKMLDKKVCLVIYYEIETKIT